MHDNHAQVASLAACWAGPCFGSTTMNGQPFMIPTAYCRIDNTIYLHGSVGSHFFRELAKGIPICIAVTHIDGLVMARSAS